MKFCYVIKICQKDKVEELKNQQNKIKYEIEKKAKMLLKMFISKKQC